VHQESECEPLIVFNDEYAAILVSGQIVGGPYSSDVGRGVPGSPPPPRVPVRASGRLSTYYLLSVVGWTDGERLALCVARRLALARPTDSPALRRSGTPERGF
jgi:hypothetical protein